MPIVNKQMLTIDDFVAMVEGHLEQTRTPPTTFGKQVLNDPNFVFDLRKGRDPGLRVVERVVLAITGNGVA